MTTIRHCCISIRSMNKFYKYNVGKYKVVFMKVYSEKPEKLPLILKQSKLVCFDEISLQCPRLGGCVYREDIHIQGLTDQETIDKTLNCYKAVEITEDEYNRVYEKLKALKEFALDTFRDIENENNH